MSDRGRAEVEPPITGSTAPTPSLTQRQPDPHSRTDPAVAGGAPDAAVEAGSKRIQRQVRRLGITNEIQDGDGALFAEPILVFNQKGKLLEVNAEYDIYGQHGQKLGLVREVGQSVLRGVMAPSNRTRRLQVLDLSGRAILALTRPAKIINSKLVVTGVNGTQIGQISQRVSVNSARFRLESEGRKVGSITGEGREQWDFSIQDAKGNEIGRITRASAGLAKEMFTKADSYVLEIHRQLDDPLHSLVIAAAVAIDTALRQR